LEKKNILILGLSYREDTKSIEYSAVFQLKSLFEEIGCKVLIHDPYYTDEEILNLALLPLGDSHLDVQVILLHTKHRDFREFELDDFENCELVFDGRNYTKNWKNTKNIPIIVLGRNRKF
jgi:UDP-N-acetyl-D-mannosaminuronate dehydrogenase